jgi:hypothetical protein
MKLMSKMKCLVIKSIPNICIFPSSVAAVLEDPVPSVGPVADLHLHSLFSEPIKTFSSGKLRRLGTSRKVT